jgi:DNA-directed RNA polymerase specialized sigma24 family protein
MNVSGSVSCWLQLLQAGDPEAAQPLWERYFAQLEALARRRLHGRALAVADAEDVALSAFDSLCRGVSQGRFPQLRDRDNLWRLLVVITVRKVAHLLRDQSCQKRSGGGPRPAGQPTDDELLYEVIAPGPTPDFAAQLAEECARLLSLLPRQELVQVARWKMEGHTNQEIATLLGCAPRTVDRKLQLIRHLWEQEDGT